MPMEKLPFSIRSRRSCGTKSLSSRAEMTSATSDTRAQAPWTVFLSTRAAAAMESTFGVFLYLLSSMQIDKNKERGDDNSGRYVKRRVSMDVDVDRFIAYRLSENRSVIGSPLLELGRAGFCQYARGSFQWEWFCYAEVAAQEFNLRTPARHVNLNKRWPKLTRVLGSPPLVPPVVSAFECLVNLISGRQNANVRYDQMTWGGGCLIQRIIKGARMWLSCTAYRNVHDAGM
ncbi:hypothetical protein F5J12DRAFT_784352 [Pisolithus orientalis]|uniref:uncharacterized protein n=1 Tax=Pisolithus orientalis TaxID=936130 RepID=UPI0022253F4D|nr:uncharacterized protein F5J12DRAFT_784352 [Pisolithus orientalis]KAI6000324.1 hypothetical protein F5J12DRAFT_784352 [Pisolithus orientalis]